MATDPSMSWEAAVQLLKHDPDSSELVESCYYDDPLLAAADRYWQSSEWRAARLFLPASRGSALDIGAGRGISSYAMARDGWQVTALEPDASAIVGAGAIRSLAAEADLPIEVIQTWGEKLPFADATFDVVHCRQALHHARHLGQLCHEIGRVLKPGGMLIALREHVISRQEDLPVFLADHPLHRFYGGERAYLLREYTDAIESAGIEITRVLNPMQSNINLFPTTLEETKARWARRLGLPSAKWVPDALLFVRGAISNVPGRLYSFIGRRPGHG